MSKDEQARLYYEAQREMSLLRAQVETLTRERYEARAALREANAAQARVRVLEGFLARTGNGGSIVSSAALTPEQIAIARAADRMLVTPDGLGFVYVPGPLAFREDA